MNTTPNVNKLHIGFFGKRNCGKSTLVNLMTGQDVSIVSVVSGTTTDPVLKSIEISGIGACVLIDTAGFDDEGVLGRMRVSKTEIASQRVDIAVLLFSEGTMQEEMEWYKAFKEKETPVLCLISKADIVENLCEMQEAILQKTGQTPLVLHHLQENITTIIKDEIIRMIPENFGSRRILGNLVKEDDLVMLVMPQDIQAPAGRLILPQAQTTRELLDRKCIIMSVTQDKYEHALASLKYPPKLIITDSQVFKKVHAGKPKESLLTSFSVLFAAYKGDLKYYLQSVTAIDSLSEASRVLIAECCTHAPLAEDIGRVKIPKILRERIGSGLTIDVVGGMDFPKDLRKYDLIIQCGACMFNRKYVVRRIESAKTQDVPMTNYGIAIAYLLGILDEITYSESLLND